MLFATLELAVEQGMAIEVVVAAALDFLGVESVFFHHLDKQLQHFEHVFATGEVHFAGFEVYVLEQLAHVVDGFHFAGAETYAVGATIKSLESQGVGLGKAVGLNVLTDVPDIVVSMFATGEGSLAWVAVEIFDVFQVFGTIVGFHFKALDCLPHKLLFIVGTFEVFDDDFFPFLRRYGRKFAEQFVVFHYVVCFCLQTLKYKDTTFL